MAVAFLDHDGPIAFAHRGGAGDWPENTMPAFEGAVRLGYRYVETDVHVTADGTLVAFHDDRLDRVTDRIGVIEELPDREVFAAKVDGAEPIPLFEDLLGAFPDLRVNVEPKSDAAVEALAASVRRCGAIDRVLIGSFVDRRVARSRELLGDRLATSLGPRGVARLVAAGRRLGRPRFAEVAAQVPVSAGKGVTLVTERFVATAHRLGLQVHVWTIDDPVEMARLLDLGVDGIMTDRPEVLRDVLALRGQWSPARRDR
ncbi:MAG TPA: glycerophosphodiester phosphodiesterase [Microthrixaceae bacterium]|nr:glycerophosphodiester phosphodiesterase [Microthrixaceae bacterium]